MVQALAGAGEMGYQQCEDGAISLEMSHLPVVA